MELPNLMDYWNGCIRVMKIAKRPSKEEFTKVLKLTGLGMLAMGALGLGITIITMLIGL